MNIEYFGETQTRYEDLRRYGIVIDHYKNRVLSDKRYDGQDKSLLLRIERLMRRDTFPAVVSWQ